MKLLSHSKTKATATFIVCQRYPLNGIENCSKKRFKNSAIHVTKSSLRDRCAEIEGKHSVVPPRC